MRTEITTNMMAAILGYTGKNRTRNARDWMRARGIDMQHTKGGPVFTTEEHLREVTPHLWNRWKEARDTYERRTSDTQSNASEDQILQAFYEAAGTSAGEAE